VNVAPVRSGVAVARTRSGKGRPGQSGWMTHEGADARFRQVNVITPKGQENP